VSSGGIGHIDPIESAAGRPEAGPPCLVIEDAQRELAVVIIDFLCSRHAIEVEGQQVSIVNLEEGDRELGSWKTALVSPNTSSDHTVDYPGVHCLWITFSRPSVGVTILNSSEDRSIKTLVTSPW